MNVAFLALTALPFVVSPGASFSMTIGAIAQGEPRVPLRVWAGTALGIALIASVAGITGLGELIARNGTARTTFGLVGGVILIGFGITSIIRGARRDASTPSTSGAGPRLVLWSFITVVTNAKALSLYALVVPTLTAVGFTGWRLYTGFAAVHIAMLWAWLSVVGLVLSAVPGLGQSPKARTWLTVGAAAALIMLGISTIIGSLG